MKLFYFLMTSYFFALSPPLHSGESQSIQQSFSGSSSIKEIPSDTIAMKSAAKRQQEKEPINLEEVVVKGNRGREQQMKSSQNTIHIEKSYIEENFSGSLMQSLEKIPGVRAMTIGSGQSKPAIRGLGFNRMVVTENGIKHEGQQWGEDHGLEIDQFAIDEIEIIKGPGALLHGSDAIGGVIQLRSTSIPQKGPEANINFYGRSNNESLGASVQLAGRNQRWYYRLNATFIDYADYKIPADSIQYYSYYIQLKDKRLRNTAGREQNAGATIGYLGEQFRSTLFVSNVHSRSGFFADAHGLEVRLSDIDYDKSSRDIDLPYHSVNHLKAVSKSVLKTGAVTWEGNLAFQRNQRKEYSEPVSHGYMPIPPNPLERQFDKNTYTATALFRVPLKEQISLQGGMSLEHQENKRGGWGFIIPNFRNTAMGIFVFGRYHLSNDLIVSAGIRGDRINSTIDSYRDWYKTPDEQGTPIYKERASLLRKHFGSISWSTGINYLYRQWTLKANLGKSFRAPTPKELGSDGVNYHIFRYEKGNKELNPEESYQLDMGIGWQNEMLSLQWEPFLNYFPNYIYLNPTSDYYEGLQMYHYAQARVVRYGFEADLQLHLNHQLTLGMQTEYLYAEQLSGEKKGYTLPFSPPSSTSFSINYHPGYGVFGKEGDIMLEYKITGKQNRIVPPEEKTEGYQLVNLSMGRNWAINSYKIKVRLQVQNLLNKHYYDHTGFYRLIDVPEPGRNLSLLMGIAF